MAKKDKALERLLARPKDFTWAELTRVLKGLGYREDNKGKTSGSRVIFLHSECAPISLHKPHPTPVLKRYQMNNVIELLKQERLI